MKKALVTGGLGFIGSQIAKSLLEQKVVDKVVCFDNFGGYINFTSKNFLDYRKERLVGYLDNIIIERGDAKYYGVLQKIIENHRPEYIFHLASLPLAKLNNLNVEEAFESSVSATSNILQICNSIENYDFKRFVYTSSSMVYGNFESEEVDENSSVNPIEIYGTAKLAGEITTKGLGLFFKIPWTIVRPSAVFGPTDMNNRISQIIIDRAINNEVINVHGKDERLDFTYVKNLADGFIKTAIHEKGENEIFNITNGKSHTILEFIHEVKKYIPDIKYEIQERDQFRPKRGTLSNSKVQDLVGFEPSYSFEEAIKEYVEFKLNNKNNFS